MKDLVWYFFKLGSFGFGGPAALVGYMRRDLVEDRKLIDESTYNLSIALAQIMPGPLAAQTAMAIGYFESGVVGATLVGLAFILPSFLMVLGLSALYVTYGGMPWMQSVFYGIGAGIIAIIAIAAYRLVRGTNKRDPLLWTIFVVMLVATAWCGGGPRTRRDLRSANGQHCADRAGSAHPVSRTGATVGARRRACGARAVTPVSRCIRTGMSDIKTAGSNRVPVRDRATSRCFQLFRRWALRGGI
jgi:chromate transport protein ChrA